MKLPTTPELIQLSLTLPDGDPDRIQLLISLAAPTCARRPSCHITRNAGAVDTYTIVAEWQDDAAGQLNAIDWWNNAAAACRPERGWLQVGKISAGYL